MSRGIWKKGREKDETWFGKRGHLDSEAWARWGGVSEAK